MPYAVVILAGGGGSRIGGAKPLRRLAGVRLIDRALAIAQGYGGPVAVAVHDEEQVAGLAAEIITDAPDFRGPLAGVAAALGFAARQGCAAVLTIACDTPFLPADLAVRLQAALEPGVGAAIPASAGRLHPSCAMWRTGTDAVLDPNGRQSLLAFAERIGLAEVEWPVDGGDPFFNINSKEELALAEEVLATGSARP